MIIRFTPEADAELAEAREWYAYQREDLDLEFMQSIDDALSQIVANPHQYPNVYRSLRRCVVRRFPFAIFTRLRRMRSRSLRSFTHVETRKDGSREGNARLLNSSPAGDAFVYLQFTIHQRSCSDQSLRLSC
jgi:plasmid stabilization system protein ParE